MVWVAVLGEMLDETLVGDSFCWLADGMAVHTLVDFDENVAMGGD
jgi:hypothetical protein